MEQVKRKKWIVFSVLILLPVLVLFLSYMLWSFEKNNPFNCIIYDKTVLTPDAQEHASFVWILNHLKITKRLDSKPYSLSDYAGFFPLKNEKYAIKDFEVKDLSEIQKIARNNDMLYITDTYGIYSREWFSQKSSTERSGVIYGGLTDKDLLLIKHFKQNKKLIIAEFNCVGSPTSMLHREAFEAMFGIKWTGWIGRYFDNLAESNEELPQWLIRNYKAQHANRWPFTKGGIAFVKENEQVEILEEENELAEKVPSIYTKPEMCRLFQLPDKVNYAYWFDIFKIGEHVTPVSLYHINTTPRGDSILNKNGILKTFPATLMVYTDSVKFFYFAGDFADNKISQEYVQLKGFPDLKRLSSSPNRISKENFFWMYYYPLMQHIMKQYLSAH